MLLLFFLSLSKESSLKGDSEMMRFILMNGENVIFLSLSKESSLKEFEVLEWEER